MLRMQHNVNKQLNPLKYKYMKKLLESLPDVFYALNVLVGCILVLLFVLIITLLIQTNDYRNTNTKFSL